MLLPRKISRLLPARSQVGFIFFICLVTLNLLVYVITIYRIRYELIKIIQENAEETLSIKDKLEYILRKQDGVVQKGEGNG